MMFRNILVLGFILGCAGVETKDEAGDDSAKGPDCARYEEEIGGACRPVEVQGIEERALSFERAGLTLYGTLTLPRAEGRYLPPVFVLAHGSGPNDRDQHASGALGANYGRAIPTFKLLAEELTQAGAAVFRHDKRSCFYENSQGRCPNRIADYGDLDSVLVDDFVDDLRAAIKTAAALEEVDGSDITVIGHSKGANYVPLVIDEEGVVAGVQLAGSALPIDEAMVGQLRDYADFLESLGQPQAEEQILALREMADRYAAGFAAIRAGTFEGDAFEGGSLDYWRNWFAITDAIEEDFKAVDKPIFTLQGELDFNVPVSHFEHFEAWAEEAEMENASFLLLPNVTHSFVKTGAGGSGLEEDFSRAALQGIVSWHRAL